LRHRKILNPALRRIVNAVLIYSSAWSS
jgi:hypothetical protein